MDSKKSIISFVKILVLAYIGVGILLLLNSSLVFDLSLNVMVLVGIFVVCAVGFGIVKRNKKFIITAGILCGAYIILAVICSPIVNYNAHRNLIGKIEEVEFSSEIEYIDLNQLPTIDKELAGKLADKKLGEIASLGSQVTVGNLDLQSVNGELYYVGPLEHSSVLKWITNREGTIGYIKVSATNQNDVELVTEVDGKDIRIKYLESAYLFSDLDRAAYFKDMKAGHTDYTFELDDTGRPYWVITRYDTAVGISESKAIGALVMDAQTGESNIYDIENLPEWIDRIQPTSYINRYLNKWGQLVHGVLNFTDKEIINYCKTKKQIHIKQGYSKCSILPLREKVVITSDMGIYKTLIKENFDVLLIPFGDIELPGLNYGFIGGVGGMISSNSMAFFGSLEKYAFCDEVKKFLYKYDIKPIYLRDSKLFDRGSLLLL